VGNTGGISAGIFAICASSRDPSDSAAVSREDPQRAIRSPRDTGESKSKGDGEFVRNHTGGRDPPDFSHGNLGETQPAHRGTRGDILEKGAGRGDREFVSTQTSGPDPPDLVAVRLGEPERPIWPDRDI